jgi:hypothetical protein
LPDGNVLGGTLDSVFAVDVTRAMGRCANCGATRARGTSRVYVQAAGTVARSPSCGEILRRLVNAPGRTFLDLRGLSFLQIAAPGGAMHLSPFIDRVVIAGPCRCASSAASSHGTVLALWLASGMTISLPSRGCGASQWRADRGAPLTKWLAERSARGR